MSKTAKKHTKKPPKKLLKLTDGVTAYFAPPEHLTLEEWADKYRRLPDTAAEPGPWRTSRTPYYREPMAAFDDPKVRKIVIVSASQTGKALDIRTPIATPDGWTTMADVKVGDILFDENGEQCAVTFATDVMHNRPCYEITFSDGAKVTADAEHRWSVYKRKPSGKEERILTTTAEMVKDYKVGNRNAYAVDVAKALKCDDAELLVPPYVLGYWLGDGNSYSNQITVGKQDEESIEHLKACGVPVDVRDDGKVYNLILDRIVSIKERTVCDRGHDLTVTGRTKKGLCAECARQAAMKYRYGKPMDPVVCRQDGMFAKLTRLDLIGNKHIPTEYLRASYDQRLELLQGLLDSDGTIDKAGRVEATFKSERLANDLKELATSLGMKPTIKQKTKRCTNSARGIVETTAHTVSFMVYDVPVFRLSRKAARVKTSTSVGIRGQKLRTSETKRRRIVDIKRVESVPVKCIQVDSPNHLYLCGREMIPTHNTEFELNCIGYIIDQDPGTILYILPTVDDARKMSKLRLAGMIRDTDVIRDRVADEKSRDGKNTILQKTFPGGSITLVGTNAPSGLASIPARYIIGDEHDRWAKSAGDEGDPWALAEKRQTTFYNAKSIDVSTPTIKGSSPIEVSYQKGTQERWCHACPDCGEYSEIVFEDVKFNYDSEKVGGRTVYTVKEPVMWCCPKCGTVHDEDVMRKQPAKWIAKNPDAYANGVRSFWLSAFCSPWTRWERICREFLESKSDSLQLRVVYNTLLGKLWEERGDIQDEETMLARREDYGLTSTGAHVELPDGVLVLTCGVDTQDNRLEYEVVGHGMYGETWGVKRGFIMGRPDSAETWEALDGIISHVYQYKDGRGLRVSITLVDSGGHFTQEVYEQCAKRQQFRVFPIKGKGGEGYPFVNPPKRVAIRDNSKRTVWLYTIGVDAGKAAIMSNLKVEEPGVKYCHFPTNEEAGYNADYFAGLLSERLVLTDKHKWAWKKIAGHQRNEPLDCRNYANAGLRLLNVDLDKLHQRALGAKNGSGPPPAAKPAPKKRQPPRRKSSVGDEW